jgi:osmoprotectant transport system permease protein
MLAGKINDSIMTGLNYRTDYLKQTPERVAKDFLVSIGMWKGPRNGHKGILRIGSKIFGEQYILSNIYAMLIKGFTDLDVVTKTGLGGTKICFDAMTNNQIDVYPEYTGTGLLVLLQPPQEKIKSLVKNKDSVYIYVINNFHEHFHIKWLRPIGFNNAYALMVRREESKKLRINNISDLKDYIDKN